VIQASVSKCAVIAAGGTGGHIFPGLALAHALVERGWRVEWLGTAGTADHPSMERRLVPSHGINFHAINFYGVRGTGLMAKLKLPLRLGSASWQAASVLSGLRPQVVVGFGGYPSMPAGIGARLASIPLLIHEQNSVAGMANRWLARWARKTYTAFPGVFPRGHWIGNPLRDDFLTQASPGRRFAGRDGPLRILVLGGSAGATVFNQVVPQALALIPRHKRPRVLHQSGRLHIDALRNSYRNVGVEAEATPFIDDVATAMADADLVICRAGASTVTELAAVGVAAVFVPYPTAVDDHQTANAQYLVDEGGGWLLPQAKLTPERLSRMLQGADRSTLLAAAEASQRMAKPGAVQKIVEACEALVANGAKP
jgi:UDP-N-acetylglucosamine--N-acetylmuramyl-(pentapeptide) pyrophosphoryl-undecaprenol N-acetylglucosamine transferase